jgi:hypothetical protein
VIVTGPQPGIRDRQHPPFSIAGKQPGYCDEWDLFPQALRLAEQISPRAVVLENGCHVVTSLCGRDPNAM